MRYLIIALWLLSGAMSPAVAQVSIAIGLPNLSIGVNVPIYPELDPVPGYPVYYAPQMNSNYFFYDGMYWVYESDNWYASSWYDGPWAMVSPMAVPVFLLRVPVRYYHRPPAYFHRWAQDMPPRWGDHWGNDWQRERSGWDRWNRDSAPARAPLPSTAVGTVQNSARKAKIAIDAAIRQRVVASGLCAASGSTKKAVPATTPQPMRCQRRSCMRSEFQPIAAMPIAPVTKMIAARQPISPRSLTPAPRSKVGTHSSKMLWVE